MLALETKLLVPTRLATVLPVARRLADAALVTRPLVASRLARLRVKQLLALRAGMRLRAERMQTMQAVAVRLRVERLSPMWVALATAVK
ncbi:hypothetical protein A4R44_00308 [Amycolatopsis sp. M39]|nr:hypothetical protein A4R44_00308 [Amycolatopsis sp. M39]